MKETGAQLAYDVVGSAALAVALPLLWCRGGTEGLGQRLGAVPIPPGGFARPPLWLHAASVGETLAVLPLFERLRQRSPSVPWVVSNTTVTGRAVARAEMAPAVSTLLPVDSLRIVDRVFARVQPRALIVVESEIWPGMLRAAERVGASIVVVSARMSAGALRRYLWCKPLFQSALGRIDAICAQTGDDAARLRELGAPAGCVHVTGNLKAGRFEVANRSPVVELGDRSVLIAASTQPGEERFVLDACELVWASHPDTLLILAPRRPERFDEVAAMLDRLGVSYQRRSASESAVRADCKVFLVDTLGELTSLFPIARAAFVGGTIAPIGGHNILEPATAGIAVSFGPDLENVRPSAQALCASSAAVEVSDPESLASHWTEMVAEPDRAREMGRRARAVAADLAGAVPATLAVIEPFLGLDR